MLVMIKTDLLTMKNYALVNLGLLLVVTLFICIGTGTIVGGVAALTVMLPFMYIFSTIAYDEMNGWERFRLTLPISRRQVISGRYASILIMIIFGAVISMVVGLILYFIASQLSSFEAAAPFIETYSVTLEVAQSFLLAAFLLLVTTLVMPLFMRFGMTKGFRIIPLVLVLFLVVVLYFVGGVDGAVLQTVPVIQMFMDPTSEQTGLVVLYSAAIFVIMLIPYAISGLIATRLYEKRQF